MKILSELQRLEKLLSRPPFPSPGKTGAAPMWSSPPGSPPEPKGPSFSDPRYVVTRCSLELSWLFHAPRAAFHAEKRLDGCSKIGFFGWLAKAASRHIKSKADADLTGNAVGIRIDRSSLAAGPGPSVATLGKTAVKSPGAFC